MGEMMKKDLIEVLYLKLSENFGFPGMHFCHYWFILGLLYNGKVDLQY